MRTEFLCVSVLRVASGPRVKLASCKSALNPRKIKSKKDYFDKLDNLLSSENSNSKLFWKTSKQLLNLGQFSNNIPTLTMNHEVAQADCQKAELLNTYFSSQTKVNDLNKPLPNIAPAQHTLESITIYTQDILDVLRHLDVNKACGPDLNSPRLLREGADFLAYPLFIVFNESLLQVLLSTRMKRCQFNSDP